MAHPLIGLGKGLDALIRETSDTRGNNDGLRLPLDDIQPNPEQPRRSFDQKSLQELADSIGSQGLLQPLLVRPIGSARPGKYEIIAGERRWRACRLAGLTEVPVLVRNYSAQDTLAAALVENLQREDLNPVEEALGLQMLKEEFGLSQDELSRKIGKSRSAIANSLRLLALPESIRAELALGRISAGHARALLSITETMAQEELKNRILEQQLSVREAEGLASVWKERGRFDSVEPRQEGDSEQTPDSGEAQDRPEQIGEACPGRSRPRSARMLELQKRIGEMLQVRVRMTGAEDKGKISFSYNSREELAALLGRFAVPALEKNPQRELQTAQMPRPAGMELADLTGSRQKEAGNKQ